MCTQRTLIVRRHTTHVHLQSSRRVADYFQTRRRHPVRERVSGRPHGHVHPWRGLRARSNTSAHTAIPRVQCRLSLCQSYTLKHQRCRHRHAQQGRFCQCPSAVLHPVCAKQPVKTPGQTTCLLRLRACYQVCTEKEHSLYVSVVPEERALVDTSQRSWSCEYRRRVTAHETRRRSSRHLRMENCRRQQ